MNYGVRGAAERIAPVLQELRILAGGNPIPARRLRRIAEAAAGDFVHWNNNNPNPIFMLEDAVQFAVEGGHPPPLPDPPVHE